MKVPLTQREEEILVLILHELQSSEIADQLQISIRTVETHRKNLLRKSGTRTMVGLVKFGIVQGLLPGYFYHAY